MRSPAIILFRSRWLAIFLLLATCTTAQELQKKLLTGRDTAWINARLDKAYQLRELYIDSAGKLYNESLNESFRTGYNHGIVDALCGLGRYYNIKNEQRKAVSYLSQAFSYLRNPEIDKEQRITTNLLLSESYYYLGQYDSCTYYRYESLNLIDNNQVTSPALRLKVYSKILQFWLNAHEDIRHDANIKQIMRHIDVMEREAIVAKDSNLLVNIYFQKEGYYHNISENDSARYYGLQNIALGRRLKVIPSMIMAAYLNIALTYIDDKNPLPAIDNIRKAIDEAPEQGRASNRYLIFADIFLGESYNMLGEYKKAITLAAPAMARAKALDIMSIMEHAHKTLADAYEGTGQYKNAALQRKLYAVVKDSLMKTEKMELSYNLEMKYHLAEKNKEIAEKELSIVKNESRIKDKNMLIIAISAGLLLIVAISLLLLRNIRHKQKLQAEKFTNLQQETQINLLKAAVSGSEQERSRIARDLHDGISGTIGSIRARVGMVYRKHRTNDVNEDFEEIMALLEDASTEIRKTAHNLMPEILLQEGLVAATEMYCRRVAKGRPVEISFNSYGKIKEMAPDLELSIYRTIQELVNNMLKHSGATQAIVQLVFNDPIIGITVEDNGKGIPETTTTQTGVGLKTIRERVGLLNGSIDITSSPGEGTSIYIELDLENKKATAV